MSSLYSKFKTSTDVEKGGVWLDYGDGTSIRIARAGGANKEFLKKIEEFRRKYKRHIDLDILSRDVTIDEAIRIYAETVVLDWKGVTDEDGTDLPCTVENVVKVFTDLPDLFDDVQAQAQNLELFRATLDQDAAKN